MVQAFFHLSIFGNFGIRPVDRPKCRFFDHSAARPPRRHPSGKSKNRARFGGSRGRLGGPKSRNLWSKHFFNFGIFGKFGIRPLDRPKCRFFGHSAARPPRRHPSGKSNKSTLGPKYGPFWGVSGPIGGSKLQKFKDQTFFHLRLF